MGNMLKSKLKKILMHNDFFFSVLQMYKYRNDKEYIQLVRGLRSNPNIVTLCPAKIQFEKPVCLIEAGGKNDGFFACVRWALDGLYFCDQHGFVPVLKFSEHSLYKDEIFSEEINPFEYYFEQPTNIGLQSMADHSYIKYSPRNGLLAENMNKGVSYDVSNEYENSMAQVAGKYLRFNARTLQAIEEYLKDKEVNLKDMLGVHIRGTDYKKNYKNHPAYISPEGYYPYIREALASKKFQGIYLATDDEEILNTFLQEFGEENVVYAKNNMRGSGMSGVHTSNEGKRYQAGLEVICDMAALSYCAGIISGLSQVSLMARVFKKSRHELYLYDQKINKGINKSGTAFVYSKEKTGRN